jgi:hypothetical protein
MPPLSQHISWLKITMSTNSLFFNSIYQIFNVFDKSYRQVLTLIDNSQLLLKLENSDLLQTYSSNSKETATFSSWHLYRRNGSSHDLLSVNAMTLAALRAQMFTLLAMHKLLCFVLAEWNNAVITRIYFYFV